MKDVAFWDIKTLFVTHKENISPLQIPIGKFYVRYQVFMEVNMKNAVFRDVRPRFPSERASFVSYC
jgi:hypothetical protein